MTTPASDTADHFEFLRSLGSSPRGAAFAGKYTGFRDNVLHLRRYIPVVLDALDRFEAETPEVIAEGSFAARLVDADARARIRQQVDTQLPAMERSISALPIRNDLVQDLREEDMMADVWGTYGKLVDVQVIGDLSAQHFASWASASWEEQAYWATYLRAHEGRG